MQNETNATGAGDETQAFETIDSAELIRASGGYYGPPGGPYPTGGGYSNVGSKPEYYRVKSGDNLTNIAQAHNESLSRLLHQNPQFQSNPNLIYPGQRVLYGHTAPNYQPTYPCNY